MRIKPSRRKTHTSWSLLKLPVSDLYMQFLSRGRIFPLASLETDGSIVGKSREKVELLSLLLLPSPSFSFSPPLFHSLCPLAEFGPRWVKCDVLLATCHLPIGSLGLPLSPYQNFWIFLLLACDTWTSLGLWFD